MGEIMAFPSRGFLIVLAALLLLGSGLSRPAIAEPNPVRMGVVLMHGKGGAPTRLVADLAAGAQVGETDDVHKVMELVRRKSFRF